MAYALFISTVLAVALLPAQSFNFRTATPGELPPGWTVNLPPSAKPVKVEEQSLLVEPVSATVRHGISAARRVEIGAAAFRLEMSFAFGGSGRAMRIWSRQDDDPDPATINLLVDNRSLLQFNAESHQWTRIAEGLEASPDRNRPRWYRLRIVSDAQSMQVWLWPADGEAPEHPTATVRAYRPGLAFDWLHLGCDRLSSGAYYRIDDIRLERAPGLSIPAAEHRELFPLWSGPPIPEFQDEIPDLPDVTHRVIHDPSDGKHTFLHGAAIIHHKGRFYANWANSPVDENSDGETLQGRHSPDAIHWSAKEVIGAGNAEGLNNSHGIFHAHNGVLWTFSARFGHLNTGVKFPGLKVEGFTLDERTGRWQSRGVVGEGMWPYTEPVRLPDGNWITGGQGPDGEPGVLISDRDDFTKWRTVKIPAPDMPRGFGETALFASSPGELVAIIRPGRGPHAWVSVSKDHGATWTEARPSNYPIGVSKVDAGTLSTGQRYLVANFPAAGFPQRDTMVIAVGRPNEQTLRKIYRLRFGPPALDFPGWAKGPQWSYPYAHEYGGNLYVVYSIGKEKCGLSIIPLASLSAD